METPEAKPKRRPRVSLLSLLLIMALVASSVTTAKLWQEVGPLRADNRRLRDEVGELSVVDRSQPYAIAVNTGDRFTQKWRFWIPEGERYQLYFADEQIPPDGVPKEGRRCGSLKPGEEVVDIHFHPHPVSGEYVLAINTPRGSNGDIGAGWFDEGVLIAGGVPRSTVAIDRDKPFVILRQRVVENGGIMNSDEPTDGFIMWLEAKP